MRIMFYINTLSGGGAQRVMANLANLFVEDGDEVIFVTSFFAEKEYSLHEKVRRRAITQERVPSLIRRNVAYVTGLRKAVQEEKPDILVAFMRQPNYRAVVASRGLKVKTIISVRVDPKVEYKGKVGHVLSRYLLPMADGCVFQTEQAKAWFVQSLQDKSQVIPNAVKPEFYGVKRNPVPGRVVTLGRLDEQKNHKLLIDAFCEAAAEIPDAELLIYGEGKLKAQLQQQIRELGMENRIRLMGLTADVAGVLAEAGCFVLSSDYEGMPNALMEAMAAGVPSISTDCPCGGPEMLIEHGKTGLLVPICDQKALADAIQTMLTQPEMAEKMGEAGRVSAQRFLPEKVFRQWKAYFASFCK